MTIAAARQLLQDHDGMTIHEIALELLIADLQYQITQLHEVIDRNGTDRLSVPAACLKLLGALNRLTYLTPENFGLREAVETYLKTVKHVRETEQHK